MATSGKLTDKQTAGLLKSLKDRFETNMPRHGGMPWSTIAARLAAKPGNLWSLYEMDRTGGEPDVIGYDQDADVYLFCDCSAESPAGRRSVCYDQMALDSRKENKPKHSAIAMSEAMGIELLTEDEYRGLQQLGVFDAKTSSWVRTPPDIRQLGGAIFCDRRYGTVFTYHNGADSYYAARGFRGMLKV